MSLTPHSLFLCISFHTMKVVNDDYVVILPIQILLLVELSLELV